MIPACACMLVSLSVCARTGNDVVIVSLGLLSGIFPDFSLVFVFFFFLNILQECTLMTASGNSQGHASNYEAR